MHRGSDGGPTVESQLERDVPANFSGCDVAAARPSPRRSRRSRPARASPPPWSPRRSARRPAAHCGTASATAAAIAVVRHRHDLVHERLHVREREVAGPHRHAARRRCWPSCRASPAGRPRATRVIFAAPAGSTPIDAHVGPRLLDRRRHAGDQPAAAHRHEHRADVRHTARGSRGRPCPAPAMIIGWSNGGTIVSPRAAASASARAWRSSDVVPAKITSAP